MKIVIPDPINITEEYRMKLAELGAQFYEDIPSDSKTLKERIKEAEIVTANYVDLTSDIIEVAERLKYIVVPAVGYEWVDTAKATKRGIKVLNCPTFNSEAVAEHAVALLLAVSKNVLASAESLQHGSWEQIPFEGIELRDKTLGFIGYGNIGTRIDMFIAGFGMHTIHVNSRSTPEEVDEMIRNVDVVCVCAPLNSVTHHLLDSRRLSLLKKTAILINVGRGAVIDQQALIKVLRENLIFGAGLDVFEDEPLLGKPNGDIVTLANLPNVIATPHNAFNTEQTIQRLGAELYENIQSCIEGKPIHVVA